MGRCAAFHLQRLGQQRNSRQRIGLVEQYGFDHTRGSSHSHSRITRSAYVDTGYVRLMQVAHGQEWPRLEGASGEKLVFPSEGCFFGPAGGKYEAYARAVVEAGVDCDVLDVVEARKRFPMFRFPTADGAVHDRTAGVIAAARTMAVLLRMLETGGVDLLPNTHVKAMDVATNPATVHVTRGGEQVELVADKVIICPGPWARQLLPFLQNRVQVARQVAAYFVLAGKTEDFGVGQWPVWGNLGAPRDEVFYGLPAFGREGIKVAGHITDSADDDPDLAPDYVAADAIEILRRFIAREFVAPVERVAGAEHCHYTNTATEDYILDLHPESEHVAIGAGFSGHGFKLAPVAGRVLCELVLDGRSSISEFEAMRRTFSIEGP